MTRRSLSLSIIVAIALAFAGPARAATVGTVDQAKNGLMFTASFSTNATITGMIEFGAHAGASASTTSLTPSIYGETATGYIVVSAPSGTDRASDLAPGSVLIAQDAWISGTGLVYIDAASSTHAGESIQATLQLASDPYVYAPVPYATSSDVHASMLKQSVVASGTVSSFVASGDVNGGSALEWTKALHTAGASM
ncbi:MAG: hypothetical protein ABR552_08765 [Actinomycetota bacterium]